VYSWGVLHHTGKMWQALDNVAPLVKPGGQLFIAIYNDVGWRSVAWRGIKACYNQMPRFLKTPFVLCVLIPGQTRHRLREDMVRIKIRVMTIVAIAGPPAGVYRQLR